MSTFSIVYKKADRTATITYREDSLYHLVLSSALSVIHTAHEDFTEAEELAKEFIWGFDLSARYV